MTRNERRLPACVARPNHMRRCARRGCPHVSPIPRPMGTASPSSSARQTQIGPSASSTIRGLFCGGTKKAMGVRESTIRSKNNLEGPEVCGPWSGASGIRQHLRSYGQPDQDFAPLSASALPVGFPAPRFGLVASRRGEPQPAALLFGRCNRTRA